jgi:diguanylate cyclase (GGDEF)-like protein
MTTSHSCSSRTCTFCRAFVREPKRGRKTGEATKVDQQTVRRARELTNTNRLVVTEAVMANNRPESIEAVVLTDSLTTVVNSRTLLRELRGELSRAHRYGRNASICMISLDGVPEISKQFGGIASDNLIKAAADVLRRCVRDVDIIGRYSSTDFLVILPETNKEGASIVAERIRNNMAPELSRMCGGQPIVMAAVATATFPVDGRQEEELIAKLTRAVNRITLQARRAG